MAMISRSHRVTECRTTSRWPLLTGSNEPGYSAMRGMIPPTALRAARQAGWVAAENRLLFFRPVWALEPHPRLLWESRLCFVPNGLVNQNSGPMKPFSTVGEDLPKRALVNTPPNETAGRKAEQSRQFRGPS